jgi:hypothetical protein
MEMERLFTFPLIQSKIVHGTLGKDKLLPLFSVVGFSFYCAPGVSFISFSMVRLQVGPA